MIDETSISVVADSVEEARVLGEHYVHVTCRGFAGVELAYRETDGFVPLALFVFDLV